MGEVLITFEQPPTLTAAEMQAWVIDRALACHRALVLSGPDRSRSNGLLLRMEVDDDAPDAAAEELTDLMLDMRLLGLRPALVPPTA